MLLNVRFMNANESRESTIDNATNEAVNTRCLSLSCRKYAQFLTGKKLLEMSLLCSFVFTVLYRRFNGVFIYQVKKG